MRRILVSAYGCESDKGSEPGVGWYWVVELARENDVWVITRCNNKLSIERGLADLDPDVAARLHFVYYDLERMARIFKRRAKGLYFYYTLWQRGAYRLAIDLHKKEQFDCCMHLTFGSMWMPTWMYRLDIPFIWGPVGGGESIPAPLVAGLPFKVRVAQRVRSAMIALARFNPFFIGPAVHASAILVRTEDSLNAMPRRLRSKVTVVLETGIGEEQLRGYAKGHHVKVDDGLVHLIFTGRLIPIKNVEMLIRAFALALKSCSRLRLSLVGDGPLKSELEIMTQRLEISQYVSFVGAVSQSEVIDRLKRSDVFLFPSLKEGGAWSLIEALAVGLPTICLDASGMRVIADKSCAYLIPITHESEMTSTMASRILELANDAGKREAMSEAARKRMRESFSWRSKGRIVSEILSRI